MYVVKYPLQVDISKFSGNLLEYNRFIRQCQMRIVNNTNDDDDDTNDMLGSINCWRWKVVANYSYLYAYIGFKAVMNEFEEGLVVMMMMIDVLRPLFCTC